VARALSKAETKQRQSAALKHGARSHVVTRRRAGYVKQSVLQAVGLRYADLDPIARRYLDLYARVATKLALYDEWAEVNGYLGPDGSTPPWTREYYAAINSAARLLSKLDAHLHRHLEAAPSLLEQHIQTHYVIEADGDD
jgi:hypothetical protein